MRRRSRDASKLALGVLEDAERGAESGGRTIQIVGFVGWQRAAVLDRFNVQPLPQRVPPNSFG
jgi:hypothetical protein